jgi:alpha-glucoside transport system permease protein
MSVQAASLPVVAPVHKPRRPRIRPSRFVVNIVLAVIAIFWLVPSVGILIISLRPNSAFEQSGWWTVLTAPAQLTFSNYQSLFSAGFKPGGVLDSLTTSLAITVPVTILVTVISSLTAYSLVFGRWCSC